MQANDYSLDTFSSTIDLLTHRKVLVLGDVGLDVYHYGKISRINPEAPIPIFENLSIKETRMGLAGNVAQNIQAMHSSASLVSDYSLSIKTLASMQGIDFQGIPTGKSAILKERYVVDRHIVFRSDTENTSPLEDKAIEVASRKAREALESKEYGAVVLSDYAKGFLHPKVVAETIQAARALNIPVVVDPKPNPKVSFAFQGATLMTPNLKEATQMVDSLNPEPSSNMTRNPEDLAPYLMGAYNLSGIIITLGERGMYVQQDYESRIIPALSQQVFDVCGAGDTVTAICSLALAAGLTLFEAAELANMAAGIVVTKFGSSTCTPEELKKYRTMLKGSDAH
jgi:D-beta-D-heptose 7-phosphate kinase/D-beta-D-heptose 1-phosphate adenosyltransferase